MRNKRLLLIFVVFHFFFFTGIPVYIRDFHHLFTTLLFGYWLLKNGIPSTPLNQPIYAFVILWFVTSITSLNPRMAFEALWTMLTHVIIFFVLADLFQKGRQRLVMEITFLFASIIIIIASLELLSWYFGWGILPHNEIGWFDVRWFPLKLHTLSLPSGVSTYLAAIVAPLITVSVGWALTVRKRDFRYALGMIAGSLFIILILTTSRGGIISLGGALGTFTIIRFTQTRRIPTFILVSGVLIGVFSIIAIFALRQTGFSGDSVRLDIYRSAIEMGLDHPITGIGKGNFGRELREYRTPSLARDGMAHVHNLYLSQFADTGLLGVIASIWFCIVLTKAWRHTWSNQQSTTHKIRVEAAIATIVGIGLQGFVDSFPYTSIILVYLVPLTYSIIGHKTVLDTKPQTARTPTIIAAIILVGYAVFLLQINRADYAYSRSLAADNYETALEEIHRAQNLDAHLTLYDLHETFVLGQIADDSRLPQDITTAILAYEYALELEPTWTLGWANLAMLYTWQDDFDLAITHMETAYSINPLNSIYGMYLAQFREEQGTATNEDIELYLSAIFSIPLSNYWQQTPLRQEAFEQYMDAASPEIQYRTFIEFDRQKAFILVKDKPQTAEEHWIAGEYALTIQNDPTLAETHFSHAIDMDKLNGDYYVSRAKTKVHSDPADAQNDLNIAYLLGTQYEHPNLVWIHFTESDEEINTLLRNAISRNFTKQNFAGSVYGGRTARFELFSELTFPGPGRAALEPWYMLAQRYLDDGDIAQAINTYTAILDYAPYEIEAQLQLAKLR